jgi:hypothetical protein
MELFNYYSLDECPERKIIKKRLTQLQNDGKIDFEIEGEVLKLTDLDLEENDVEELTEMFDKYDVFPYPDYEENMIDEDDYYDDYDGYSEEDDY